MACKLKVVVCSRENSSIPSTVTQYNSGVSMSRTTHSSTPMTTFSHAPGTLPFGQPAASDHNLLFSQSELMGNGAGVGHPATGHSFAQNVCPTALGMPGSGPYGVVFPLPTTRAVSTVVRRPSGSGKRGRCSSSSFFKSQPVSLVYWPSQIFAARFERLYGSHMSAHNSRACDPKASEASGLRPNRHPRLESKWFRQEVKLIWTKTNSFFGVARV
mmetsp:Transcript_26963/g.67735  ORF Transcript_26963/g.67735 Transcript_26963/m.67735 type:complete len:215 (-) Transcript_26963:374-1018(-)